MATGAWDEAAERGGSLPTRLPVGYWEYFTAGSVLADRGDFVQAREVAARLSHIPSSGTAMLQGITDHVVGAMALAIWTGEPDRARELMDLGLEHIPDPFLVWRGGELFWRALWAEADLAARARADRDPAAERAALEAAHQHHRADARGDGGTGRRHAARRRRCWPTSRCARPSWPGSAGRTNPTTGSGPSTPSTSSVCASRAPTPASGWSSRCCGPAATVTWPRSSSTRPAPRWPSSGPRRWPPRSTTLARRSRLSVAAPSTTTPGDGTGDDDDEAEDQSLGLSPRELQVLALVAEGATNRQVAEQLYISPKTASVHVSNILAKLGVSSRGEAAALARRLGVVTDP